MAPARDPEFLREVWALYAVGTVWLFARFAVGIRQFGIKGLRLDDGFALIALAAWTYTIAVIHITYHTGTNTDYTSAEVAHFDEQKIRQLVYGSKLFLGSWYAYIVLIFSLKAAVLVLYWRIFFERWQIWVLRITSVLCMLGFTAITLGLSLRCLPYHQRWQVVPQPPIHCTASPKVLITASCVNAVTDVLLLSVPIPILWTLNKPLRTRIGVFVLLASGLFVLIACILRVSLTVVPNISVLRIARWGVREFCIAIVAVNSASLRPLLRKSFWRPKARAAEPREPRRKPALTPLQRVRQHLSRSRHGEVLNSTSAGASTIDAFAHNDIDEDVVFEDPDYQVVNGAAQSRQQTVHSTTRSANMSQSQARWSASGRQSTSRIAASEKEGVDVHPSSQHEVDLEKGIALNHAELIRTDSGMPWARPKSEKEEEDKSRDEKGE